VGLQAVPKPQPFVAGMLSFRFDMIVEIPGWMPISQY
jgi:hypothetical protein